MRFSIGIKRDSVWGRTAVCNFWLSDSFQSPFLVPLPILQYIDQVNCRQAVNLVSFPGGLGDFLYFFTKRPKGYCTALSFLLRSHSSLFERSVCEADRWPLSSDKVKNEWRHTSTVPHSTSWHLQWQLYFYHSLSFFLRPPLFFVLLFYLLHHVITFFCLFPFLIFLSHFPSFCAVHTYWLSPRRLEIVRLRTLSYSASNLILSGRGQYLKERDVLKHLGVNWRIILKWIC
jgi:hypothetical protein